MLILLAPESLWTCAEKVPGAMMGSTRPVCMIPHDMRQYPSTQAARASSPRKLFVWLTILDVQVVGEVEQGKDIGKSLFNTRESIMLRFEMTTGNELIGT